MSFQAKISALAFMLSALAACTGATSLGGEANTTTPPVLGDEPTYNGATDALLISDGFEAYSGSSDFQAAYPVGRNYVVSFPASGRPGGQCLRCSYTAESEVFVGTEWVFDQAGRFDGTLPELASPFPHF